MEQIKKEWLLCIMKIYRWIYNQSYINEKGWNKKLQGICARYFKTIKAKPISLKYSQMNLMKWRNRLKKFHLGKCFC